MLDQSEISNILNMIWILSKYFSLYYTMKDVLKIEIVYNGFSFSVLYVESDIHKS